jgi:hypothetical protein
MRIRLLATSALVALAAFVANSDEPAKYGAGVSLQTATPIMSVLQQPADFAGKTVRVEGIVTAVCAHEGCWMTLAPASRADGLTLRLKVDDGVIVFPVSARGKRAVAQGVIERVGDAEGHEAAAEHARQAGGSLAEASRHWQLKATGALVY